MIRSLACWLTSAVVACHGAAIAQDKPAGYPVRPIRIIVSVAPGAGADTIARAIAQMLGDRWGQNAVVDNRPGGTAVIATELVARSAPDEAEQRVPDRHARRPIGIPVPMASPLRLAVGRPRAASPCSPRVAQLAQLQKHRALIRLIGKIGKRFA